jgi:hypothetical protein
MLPTLDVPPDGRDILAEAMTQLPPGATVVDYGCSNWTVSALARQLGRSDLAIIGTDPYGEPPNRPAGTAFMPLPQLGAPLPVADVDMVVAANVLEHCQDGVGTFRTWLEAVRLDGLIYVEAPSETTVLLASDPDVEGQAYNSFWDDPTHVRPWPPAALYRLGLSFGARPECCRYAMRAGNHSGVALFRRIEPGPPRYRYVSLMNVPRGVDAALRHVNSLKPPPGGPG